MNKKAPGLSHGLNIIDLIMEHGGLGFNELKQQLQLTPSSLNRYLHTLQEEAYIAKDSNHKYVPGEKLMTYWHSSRLPSDGETAMYPILETLARTTPFTALWITFEHGKMVCKEKAVNPDSISMQNVGEVRTDYLQHPWGYLLLETYSEKERARMLAYANHSFSRVPIPEPATQELWAAHIREHGYADDLSMIYPGIRRIAFPQFDKHHRLIGAIALGAVHTNVNEEIMAELVKRMKKIAI